MDDPTAETTARRARAMWAYSLLAQDELAAKAGLHGDRFRALLGRKNPKLATVEELWAIANASGVPPSFAQTGFEDHGPESIAELRSAIQKLQEGLGRVSMQVRMMAEGGRKADTAVNALRSVKRATEVRTERASPETAPDNQSRDEADASSAKPPTPDASKRNTAP